MKPDSVSQSPHGLAKDGPVASIRRAVVQTFDPATRKATVQITGSLTTYLAGVSTAGNIDDALMVAGAKCGIVFFDDSNPNDACIAFVY